MGKSVKIWLIIGVILTVMGLIMFLVPLAKANFDFSRLGTDKYVTNTYELTDAFDNISIQTDTADVTLLVSQDGSCKVECFEDEKAMHSVAVQEGTLTICLEDERAWYDHIGIHFDSPKITVYLPNTKYEDMAIGESTGAIVIPKDFSFDNIDIFASTGAVKVSASAADAMKIKTTTGDILVENCSAGSMELSVSTGLVTVKDVVCQGDMGIRVSTGKIELTDVTCKNLVSPGSTGDVILKYVIAEEKMSIERGTGDVKFENCDASELFVETDTGDVYGSLLSAKVFIADTDTGSVNVPKSTGGGRCEIHTDTGNIKITIP